MAFQFKIQIRDIPEPPVWRRLVVPESFSFFQLHQVIQAAFGWTNSHLFQFGPRGYASDKFIGMPDPEYQDEDMQDSREVRLDRVFLEPEQRFTYIYDFGDDWIHNITLEAITGDKLIHADCLQGKGACPPEDCGGPGGYYRLKMTDGWDARRFDLEEKRSAVQEIG
jgi:hypothetical protein